jgi:hypothetical protein
VPSVKPSPVLRLFVIMYLALTSSSSNLIAWWTGQARITLHFSNESRGIALHLLCTTLPRINKKLFLLKRYATQLSIDPTVQILFIKSCTFHVPRLTFKFNRAYDSYKTYCKFYKRILRNALQEFYYYF